MGKNSWLVKAFLAMPFPLKVKFIKGFTGSKKYRTIPGGGKPHVDMKELLMCALCPNMCRFECPSLRVTRKEMYAPATKARLSYHMLRGNLDPADPHSAEVPYICTNCDGCKQWCPMDISTGKLLKGVRADLAERGHAPASVVEFDERVRENGTTFTRGTFTADPGFDVRDENPDVFYYMGCVMAEKKPDAVKATIAILKKAGLKVATYAGERQCCGGPSFTVGFPGTTAALGKRTIELIQRSGARLVVSDCPACTDTIRQTYRDLGLKHDLEVTTTTVYFKQLIDAGKLVPSKRVDLTVAYHDPCIAARGFGDVDSARRVLASIPGLVLKEPFLHGKETQCCGMGGVSHVHHPELSEAIGTQRWDQLVATGAGTIVTSCPACEEGFSIAAGPDAGRVLDVSEVLARAL